MTCKENKTILVVDDDKLSLSFIKLILEKEGFNIIICDNGIDAQKKFKKYQDTIDLVIMDIQLPKAHGFDVISSMKSINSSTPIIGHSANSLLDFKTKCMELGCNFFLPKPCKRDDVITLVNKVLYSS